MDQKDTTGIIYKEMMKCILNKKRKLIIARKNNQIFSKAIRYNRTIFMRG